MKGEDVLEPPSGNTTSREDRQVRDKKTGAAGKTAPVEGATPGLAGLSQGSWWKTKAKMLWVFNGVKKSFFLLFFVLFCFFFLCLSSFFLSFLLSHSATRAGLRQDKVKV